MREWDGRKDRKMGEANQGAARRERKGEVGGWVGEQRGKLEK